jgi:hypothetical protein
MEARSQKKRKDSGRRPDYRYTRNYSASLWRRLYGRLQSKPKKNILGENNSLKRNCADEFWRHGCLMKEKYICIYLIFSNEAWEMGDKNLILHSRCYELKCTVLSWQLTMFPSWELHAFRHTFREIHVADTGHGQ